MRSLWILALACSLSVHAQPTKTGRLSSVVEPQSQEVSARGTTSESEVLIQGGPNGELAPSAVVDGAGALWVAFEDENVVRGGSTVPGISVYRSAGGGEVWTKVFDIGEAGGTVGYPDLVYTGGYVFVAFIDDLNTRVGVARVPQSGDATALTTVYPTLPTSGAPRSVRLASNAEGANDGTAVYLSYTLESGTAADLYLTRSLSDFGTTWDTPTSLGSVALGRFDGYYPLHGMGASPTHLHLAFVDAGTGTLTAQSSADGGSSFSSPVALGPHVLDFFSIDLAAYEDEALVTFSFPADTTVLQDLDVAGYYTGDAGTLWETVAIDVDSENTGASSVDHDGEGTFYVGYVRGDLWYENTNAVLATVEQGEVVGVPQVMSTTTATDRVAYQVPAVAGYRDIIDVATVFIAEDAGGNDGVYAVVPVAPLLPGGCKSAASGDWSSPATWTNCLGSTPADTSSATILANHSVSITASVSVAEVKVDENADLTIDAVFSVDNATIERFGTLTFAPGGNLSVADSLTSSVSLDVVPGAQLNVAPGAVVRLGAYVSIIHRAYACWTGTAAEPIRVEQLDPQSHWSYVRFSGDGSCISHVNFDGGIYGLYLNGSQNVTVNYSTFQGSRSYGVYLYNAEVSSFKRNTVTGSGSRGVYVGYASVFYMHGYAFNKVYNNGSHELYLGSTSARLYAGENGPNGRNDIYDNVNSSGYYVYSLAKTNGSENWTVPAEWNWWGASSPPSSKFYGSVDRYPYLSSSNFSSGSSSARGVVVSSAPEKTTSVLSAGVVDAIAARAVGADMEGGAKGAVSLKEEFIAMRQRIAREGLWPWHVHHVHELARLDPDDTTGERGWARALLAGARAVMNGNGNPPAANSRARRSGEIAAVLHVKDLVAAAEYDEAETLINVLRERIGNSDFKTELLLSEALLYSQTERYTEALAALEAAELIGPEPGQEAEYDAPDYEPVKEELIALGAEPGTAQAARDAQDQASIAELPEQFGLDSPYPNPARGAVELPLRLAEPSTVTVEVYDVTGRRVAVLAKDESREAGVHRLRLNGRSLATGTYVVRARATDGESTQVANVRLTLVK